MSKCYAVLTDIHGNLPALEAVIADARAQGANAWLNLGDIVSGPLWPRETAELLMGMAIPTIAGNHERQVLTQSPERMGSSDRFAFEQLTPAQRDWIASLPATMWPEPDFWCVHGTPDSDLHYLLETVEPQGARAATADEIQARLPDTGPAKLLLCGHTHMPRNVLLGSLRLANPGSVGLPAFDWDWPYPHNMETGTPQSRYALVERSADGWTVQLRAVDYDFEPVARRAEQGGRPDWADALRTGRVGRRESELSNA